MTIPPPPAIPVKISALPAVSSVASTDLIPVVQSGVTSRATAAQIASGGLVPSGVTAGTYGTASQVGQFTVNAQGLLTSASDIAIAIAASQVTSGQLALARGGTGADLSATGGANQFVRQSSVGGAFTVSTLANADLPDSGVSAATYGSGTAVPVIAVNVKGVITSATTAAVDVPGSLGTQTANTVYSGPASAGPSAPTFRALVNADIPATLTGKAFNGTLGATTPSTAVVTTLTANSSITLSSGAASAIALIGSNAGTTRAVRLATGSSTRWDFLANSEAEAGANAGSNFGLNRYDDSGTLLGTMLFGQRSNGDLSLGGSRGAESIRITPTASQNRWVTIAGGNSAPPTIGASSGGILNISATTLTIASGTSIPAGGTAGTGIQFGSASTNPGIFFGSGAPTLSAGKGSLYLRSDGTGINDRMYVNTNGSTTWTAVVTVA